MTQAIHYIDLLQWFMGNVAEVYGKINTYKHGEHIEVEDSATAVITFTSGAMATLEASTAGCSIWACRSGSRGKPEPPLP